MCAIGRNCRWSRWVLPGTLLVLVSAMSAGCGEVERVELRPRFRSVNINFGRNIAVGISWRPPQRTAPYSPFVYQMRTIVPGLRVREGSWSSWVYFECSWFLAGPIAAILAIWFVRLVRRRSRGVSFDCPQCGYNLRGSVSDRCPECGWKVTSGRRTPSA